MSAKSNLSLADANRDHWDKMAHTYESLPWQKTMIATLTAAIRARRSTIFGFPADPADPDSEDAAQDQPRERAFRLLDYACGTGTVTRALGPFASSTVGLDVSPKMVGVYNEAATSGGLAARALVGDLLASPAYVVRGDGTKSEEGEGVLEGDEFKGFDAVVVGLGFHHFDGWARCLGLLAGRCRVDGVVGVVDFLVGDGEEEGHLDNKTPDGMRHIMHKSGFSKDEMCGYMREAGLVDVRFDVLPETVHMEIHGRGSERQVFFASGKRAA